MTDDQPIEMPTPEPSAEPETEADRIRHISYGAEGLGAFLLLGLGLLVLLTRSPSPGIFAWLLRFGLGAVGLAFWIGGVGLRWGWRGAAPTIIAAAPALAAVSVGTMAYLLASMLHRGAGHGEGLSLIVWSIAAVIAAPGIPLWVLVSYAWSLPRALRRLVSGDAVTEHGPATESPRRSALAVVAFVLSLPPLVLCYTIFGRFFVLEIAILALLLALLAQVQIRRSRGRLGGTGFAAATAVVYVFTVMMYPAFLKEAARAYTLTCLSHSKQLALAMQSYLQDHHDVYPAAGSWSDALKPYVSADTFRCPHSKNKRCGFAFNAALGSRRAADTTAGPARLVLFYESDAGWNAHGGPELLPGEPRHFGGDNVSFVDGHAKWVGRLRQGDSSPPRWQRAYPPEAVVWDPDAPTAEGDSAQRH
jgi:hypothetical protein